jgi:hypothetical protein
VRQRKREREREREREGERERVRERGKEKDDAMMTGPFNCNCGTIRRLEEQNYRAASPNYIFPINLLVMRS